MKVLKRLANIVFFTVAFQLSNTYAQLLGNNSTRISTVLNMNFPDSVSINKEGVVNNYVGGDSVEAFELMYFDTVVVKISHEEEFSLALKSFVAGRFAGDDFKAYELQLTDTIIGNLPGLFISGKTNNKLQEVKKLYCFVTIANSKSYWFFYYQSLPGLPASKTNHFFSAIQFDKSKIKEAAFKIRAFKKYKPVGKVWHPSPELDYPMMSDENKKVKEEKSSYLPPPVYPPIKREWVVQANKLAADYRSNQLQADKKYKKNRTFLIVTGIVKEIIQINDYYSTVILDGGAAKIYIQCERVNTSKLKNLKKGMKAFFYAHCEGLNGNIILSGCIYIEKPTFM